MNNNLILKVLSEDGVELRDMGHYYCGVCPFHDETKGSFVIYKNTMRFVCFGCGVKGDAIDYVMLRDGVGYWRALKTLGIDKRGGKRIIRRPSLVEVLAEQEKGGVSVGKKYGYGFVKHIVSNYFTEKINECKDKNNVCKPDGTQDD